MSGFLYRLKGGTATALAAVNPLLQKREPAVEHDTGRMKIGDGVTLWNDLPYVSPDLTVLEGLLPPGGSTGQVLAKEANADYATGWIDPPEGGAPTGASGPHPFLLMGA